MVQRPRFSIKLLTCPLVKHTGNNNFRILHLFCSIGNKEKLSFLIDTGADLSLIKRNSILKNTTIWSQLATRIDGISSAGRNTQTLGTAEATIIINDTVYTQEFQVVDDSVVDLDQDGLLGADILKKCGMRIDFGTQSISFNKTKNNVTTAPFKTEFVNYARIWVQTMLQCMSQLTLQKHGLNSLDCHCIACTIFRISISQTMEFKFLLVFQDWFNNTVEENRRINVISQIPYTVFHTFDNSKCPNFDYIHRDIPALFTGEILYLTCCTNCNFCIQQLKPFYKLKFICSPSIQTSLNNFLQTRKIDKDFYPCTKCRKPQTLYKQYYFSKTPDYLSN